MHEQPFTRQDAENAKQKNIIEIALSFSAMKRVFARNRLRRYWSTLKNCLIKRVA
jgi:hypothetical protein